jgi:hypothetical protein
MLNAVKEIALNKLGAIGVFSLLMHVATLMFAYLVIKWLVEIIKMLVETIKSLGGENGKSEG